MNKENGIKISDILSRLLFEYRMKATELARQINVPQPTIHRIVSGKSPNPHQSSLEAIAQHFSISVAQLKGESPLPSTLIPIQKQSLKQAVNIPVINWDSLLTLQDLHSIPHNIRTDTLLAAANVNPRAFAVNAPDDSMHPNFSQNTLLIFDPDKPPKDRSYVLSRCHDQTVLFRQLLIDDDYQYLSPLNPNKKQFRMRILENGDKITATLIEARRQYGDL